ncbi:MAG: zinc-binding dehydrogenase, partial [Saprospiraceae bacterium]
HTTSYLDYVRDNLDGRVDVVFDNLGGKSVKEGKSILARGGRIITLGAASISGKKSKLSLVKLVLGFGFFSPIAYLTKSQSLIGVNMLKIADHRRDIIAHEFKEVQKLYEDGILKPHVGKVFEHTQLAEAHAFVEDRHSIGKVVVKWE